VLQQNLGALDAAVAQGSEAAQALERALGSRAGVSPLVQFLFGHGSPHAQCEMCFEFASHACTEASGRALALKTMPEQVCGRWACLVCFCERRNLSHLYGHLLTHAPDSLRNVGLHAGLLLRRVEEKHPHDPQAEQRQTARIEQRSRDAWPGLYFAVGELLAHNPGRHDGLTLLLLRTLGREALLVAEEQDQDQVCLALRLSEPSRWMLLREDGRWKPVFVGADAYAGTPPCALLSDGTFAPGPTQARVSYEVGAMLALVASGEWKRHATAHADNPGKLLAPVSWHAARQALMDDGRAVLAQRFDQFFAADDYAAALQALLVELDAQTWNFSSAWTPKDKPRAVEREEERQQ
jgi:hypothetical protein